MRTGHRSSRGKSIGVGKKGHLLGAKSGRARAILKDEGKAETGKGGVAAKSGGESLKGGAEKRKEWGPSLFGARKRLDRGNQIAVLSLFRVKKKRKGGRNNCKATKSLWKSKEGCLAYKGSLPKGEEASRGEHYCNRCQSSDLEKT